MEINQHIMCFLIVLCISLFPNFVRGGEGDSCTYPGNTTCFPEDPYSVYECFSGPSGWQPTRACEPDVCCMNDACCSPQLDDCTIGAKRCSPKGNDILEQCIIIEGIYGEPDRIAWFPIEECRGHGYNYVCRDRNCIDITVDGDQDGDFDVPDRDHELDDDRTDTHETDDVVDADAETEEESDVENEQDFDPDLTDMDHELDDDRTDTHETDDVVDADAETEEESGAEIISSNDSSCQSTGGISGLLLLMTLLLLRRSRL